MIFERDGLIELMSKIAINLLQNADIDTVDRHLSFFRNFPKKIDRDSLEAYSYTFVDDLEVLGYIIKQVIATSANKEEVILGNKEIELYYNLAQRYIKNTKMFDEPDKTKNI